jgi:hypothetical protein
VLLNTIGGILFLATGAITLSTWTKTEVPLACMKRIALIIGSLCVFNAFFYFLDAWLAYKIKTQN